MYKITYKMEGRIREHECPDFNDANADWVIALNEKMVWFNKDNVIKIEKI